MLSLLATKPSTNEKNGNGKYRPLRKRRRRGPSDCANDNFNYFANTDLTMKFDSSKDPIYFAFDCLDNRSVPELMGDFIQDSFFQITNFVSKIAK